MKLLPSNCRFYTKIEAGPFIITGLNTHCGYASKGEALRKSHNSENEV
jgi:hypothetical protein